MLYSPNGTRLTPVEEATALTLEARKQGISYGRLVANTSGYEQSRIIYAYCEEKRARKREWERKWKKSRRMNGKGGGRAYKVNTIKIFRK